MNDNEQFSGTTAEAVVALGSNIGNKIANLDEAVARLTATPEVTLIRRSRNYRTPPWGNTDQDWFVNGAMLVNTSLSPHDLLGRCLQVETEMGRRRIEKWGPRIIDLDVLVYGDVEIAGDILTLPHPQITKRAFVLAPLAELRPDLEIDGRSVGEWLATVDREGIDPIA